MDVTSLGHLGTSTPVTDLYRTDVRTKLSYKMFKRPCIEKEEQMTAVRRVKSPGETQTPTRRTLLHPAAPPQPKPQETFK